MIVIPFPCFLRMHNSSLSGTLNEVHFSFRTKSWLSAGTTTSHSNAASQGIKVSDTKIRVDSYSRGKPLNKLLLGKLPIPFGFPLPKVTASSVITKCICSSLPIYQLERALLVQACLSSDCHYLEQSKSLLLCVLIRPHHKKSKTSSPFSNVGIGESAKGRAFLWV